MCLVWFIQGYYFLLLGLNYYLRVFDICNCSNINAFDTDHMLRWKWPSKYRVVLVPLTVSPHHLSYFVVMLTLVLLWVFCELFKLLWLQSCFPRFTWDGLISHNTTALQWSALYHLREMLNSSSKFRLQIFLLKLKDHILSQDLSFKLYLFMLSVFLSLYKCVCIFNHAYVQGKR